MTIAVSPILPPAPPETSIRWYTTRAHILLPALLGLIGMLGFLSYTPATRLAALETRALETAGEVRQLRAEAAADRQLIVGLVRFQCLAASPRELALSGLPCDTLLGDRARVGQYQRRDPRQEGR